MLHFGENLCACRKSYPLLLEVCYSVKQQLLKPSRTITYKFNVKKSEKTNPEDELKPLTGFDDPNFTHNLGVTLRNPKLLLKGFWNLGDEIKRFCKEEIEYKKQAWNIRMENEYDRIDILHKFEKADDLNGFEVDTDASFSCGFSSASLKVTRQETGLFSGHLCEDVPKDGNVEVAGFATMFSPVQHLAFFRTRRYDWTEYTHLVFKIRGDGRTYIILLHVPGYYEETKHFKYAHPLYTRGGPYWQIVKMPFSHFFMMVKGALPHRGHSAKLPMRRILRMGITAAGFGGDFKLEIDYIGLTKKKNHNVVPPYEEYRH